MEGNYIRLYRKMLDWEWYQNINTKVVFLHFLLKANWRDGRFQGRIIPRGSFVSSIRALSQELGLSDDEVRTAVKHLQSSGEVTKQTTNKFTVFTVTNYAMYQDVTKQIPDEPQANPKQIPDEPQTITKLFPTIEKGKKERNNNKKNMFKADALELFERIWKLYPVKRGKGQVSLTQKLKLLQIGFDEMSRTIERYKKHVEGVDYLNYQNGSTFFNSGYVDYLDENYIELGNIGKKPKGSFNSIEKRDYDFDRLEKELNGQ